MKKIYVAVAVLLVTTTACHKTAAKPSMAAAVPLVTVATPTTQNVPRYLDEIGRNAAYESVTVTPQVSGHVVERRFRDGDNLHKGQLLFVMDTRPFQTQVDSARATLAQQKAALDYARIEFARYQEIVGTNAVSKMDYDSKKNAVETDQALVQSAQAALETAQLNLQYCYIHSPIDGRAGARMVDAGNVVTANTTPLLSIQRIDPMYATFTITEADLPQVQQAMSQRMLTAAIRLPSDTDTTARPALVDFLDNTVQNGTGTVNLRATINNRDHHFWPGQFVNVRLVLATEKSLLVPAEATMIGQQGSFVYAVKADDTAEMRPVQLGQQQGDQVVVIAGLAPNDRVVLQGQGAVKPGAKVRVQSAPEAVASNAPKQSAGGGS
ncbi:MAG: rane fusion protein multidrug efflux system [Thermoanaerobaculia bacterium]|jgi:multidrug efflux system membrane fusion protein|nr:rane fusion protein multidrug efflux system [Thermoanaerobaculia bacterium]